MNTRNVVSALVSALALAGGCRGNERSESQRAAEEARRLIAAISTNQSIKAVEATRGVRDALPKISSRKVCLAVMAEWRSALFNVPVERLSPSDRYGVLREASRVLTESAVAVRGDVECSYEEVWDEYFRVIDWLGLQGRRMRALARSACDDDRLRLDRWAYYQALMEWRESLIENLELNGFDEARYPKDVGKMATIRAKFERQIGRPVRRSEGVKYLGRYRRAGRASATRPRRTASTSRACGASRCLCRSIRTRRPRR